MKAFRFGADVEASDYIRVTPPRTVNSALAGGGTIEIPWTIEFEGRVELSFLAEAKLIELRNAITAALNEAAS